MDKKITLPENIVLIDVEYLNFMLTNMKGFLEQQIGRPLDNISVADLLTCLALDAKVEEGEKEIQVLLLHDKKVANIAYASPSNLQKELNGVAFKSSLGEFVFSAVSTEDLTTVDQLFKDLFEIALDDEKVKKILFVAPEDYDGEILSVVKEKQTNKEICQFRVSQPTMELPYQIDMLVFPIMKAFGVQGDEI